MTMPDYYVEFSEALADLTVEEEEWLREQLAPVYRVADQVFAEGAVPADVKDEAKLFAHRVCLATGDPEEHYTGLFYEFQMEGDRRSLWLASAEGDGDIELAAVLVRQFLAHFRENCCWTLEWCCGCSKPVLNAFGGGAVFVTARCIEYYSTRDWIKTKRAEFEASRTCGRDPGNGLAS
jgi:hypothetical protein